MLSWISFNSWFFPSLFMASLKEVQIVFCGVLSLFGALILILKSGRVYSCCFRCLLQIKIANLCWDFFPNMCPIFFFFFSDFHCVWIFPRVSVYTWVLCRAFPYMFHILWRITQHAASIQGKFNFFFIADFTVFSFCLPGVFTLQQRGILVLGMCVFWNWSTLSF